MIGESISHYKILEKLGEGGMGVVYKAQDTKLDRTVALKFLPPELTRYPEARERFIHEAKAAAALEHHNICNIHEIEETGDGQIFIAMACYEGQTLKDKIDDGPLELEEAIGIAIQVAQGLARAHEREIVHRDIKPANIMLDKDSVAKIMDFGIAKLVGGTKLTKTGITVGTIAYMSPEQARGEEIDHRTDIWSLGVVLYEMTTGQLPFKGDYEQAVINSILNEEPVPIVEFRPDVPQELEWIVQRAMQKNISERYQDIDEMLADLKRLSRGAEVEGEIQPLKTLKRKQKKKWIVTSLVTVGVIVLLVAGYLLLGPEKEPKFAERKSVAVLPFKNLSDDKTNEYFSDGITEDIITHLSKIGDLKVISRTSTMLYKSSNKTLREIGKELDVATILEGSVRRADNRVRIFSQLVDAQTDGHIWAETYDRDLSDIFAIQSDVAQKIAGALKVTLSPEERERIVQKPTDNLEAYNYYLRGREYGGRSYEKNDYEIAIDLFEKAVRADPSFAEAYAGITAQHCRMYWLGFDRSQERLIMAKEAIDKALNLKPEEPLVRAANGLYFYWGFRDYARALDEFSFALRKEPGNAWFNANFAAIQRRLGKFEDALKNWKIAFQHDPRSNILALEVGNTYLVLRMYIEAEDYYDQAISLAPDLVGNYIAKAWIHICKTGSTDSARQVLDEVSKRVNPTVLLWNLAYYDIYDGRYQDALERLASIQEEVLEWQTDYIPKDALRGFIYKLMGHADQARTHYKKAQTSLEKKVHEWPDDARMHAELGKVYAHLGIKDEAIREGQTAVNLISVSRDAMVGPDYLTDLAEIYTIVGNYDAAIDKLEYLLEIPSWEVHIGALQVNPVWAPLRDHSKFQKLLEGEK